MAKKRKKSRPPGVDPNERRRERLEARRQAKAEALAAQQRARTRERVIRWVVVAGIAVFSVWFLFFRGAAPDSIAGANGEYDVEHFSLRGAGDHVESAVAYDSTPPVAGPHSQRPAECGTHARPISNENLVHTLEHGAVGIVYRPDTDVEQIEEIEGIVRSYDSHTFSAPFSEEMETQFAVLAWGHMMRLDELDETAVRNYIAEFRQGGDAPEAFQDCPNLVRESGAATPTPAPTLSIPEEESDGAGDGGAGGGGGGGDRQSGGKGNG